MIGFNDLVNGFNNLGIRNGDILMVHSSYNSFGGVEGGARTVIKALLIRALVAVLLQLTFCLASASGIGLDW